MVQSTGFICEIMRVFLSEWFCVTKKLGGGADDENRDF